jgi:hypothetical protein
VAEAPRVRNPIAAVEKSGYVLALALTLLSGLLWGIRGLISAAVGAAIACLNLWIVRRLVDRALREAAAGRGLQATQGLVAGFVLKMPIVFVLVYLAVSMLDLDIVPFALGLSALVMAIVLGGLYVSLKDTDR